MPAHARYVLLPLFLTVPLVPTGALAEQVLAVKFPQGARDECSTPAAGQFTVGGTGRVVVTITIIPYKSLGYSPNVPVAFGLTEANLSRAIPLPGFQKVTYTQLGQETGSWEDGVPLVIETVFDLDALPSRTIEVAGYPQCWMMPQNVYWQEGQELHVDVSAAGGADLSTPPGGGDNSEEEPEDGEDEAAGIGGVWATSEGVLTLEVDGRNVRGTYVVDEGRVEGTISGNVLTGYWGEAGSNRACDTERLGTRYWGRIAWTFTDGTFAGSWGYCEDEPASPWTGSKAEPN